jgi:hypothetical protein
MLKITKVNVSQAFVCMELPEIDRGMDREIAPVNRLAPDVENEGGEKAFGR